MIQSGRAKVHPSLANSSFFIFASHTIYMLLLGKLLLSLLKIPDEPWALLCFYLMVPLLTSVIAYIIYIFLKRYLPTFCGLLTGGR